MHQLTIAGKAYRSRLLVGTGKYKDFAETRAAIARGTSYAVIPWPMGVVAKILRALPNWLYDRLFTSAPRKPRGLLK